MNFNNRTAHWVASMDLYEMVIADPELLAPVDRPDLDRMIALATLHATCAGAGSDVMGLQDARKHLLAKRADRG